MCPELFTCAHTQNCGDNFTPERQTEARVVSSVPYLNTVCVITLTWTCPLWRWRSISFFFVWWWAVMLLSKIFSLLMCSYERHPYHVDVHESWVTVRVSYPSAVLCCGTHSVMATTSPHRLVISFSLQVLIPAFPPVGCTVMFKHFTWGETIGKETMHGVTQVVHQGLGSGISPAGQRYFVWLFC